MYSVTDRQRIIRLKHLERVMREVAKKPPAAFDMTSFGHKWANGAVGAPPCGTSACAAGWAGLDPRIRAMGLKTTMHKDAWLAEPFTLSAEVRCKGAAQAYGESGSFGAAQVFFGLTEREAVRLFCVYRSTPIKKAKQVASLRKQYEAEARKR